MSVLWCYKPYEKAKWNNIEHNLIFQSLQFMNVAWISFLFHFPIWQSFAILKSLIRKGEFQIKAINHSLGCWCKKDYLLEFLYMKRQLELEREASTFQSSFSENGSEPSMARSWLDLSYIWQRMLISQAALRIMRPHLDRKEQWTSLSCEEHLWP